MVDSRGEKDLLVESKFFCSHRGAGGGILPIVQKGRKVSHVLGMFLSLQPAVPRSV